MDFPEYMRKGFKDFVTGRCGLYFKDHDLKNLEDAVTVRAKSCGFASIPAYYNYLTASDKKEDEFRELLNLLTVNHTYFFRNEPHFRVLKEKVLPEIIRKKRKGQFLSTEKPKIRIWSAGCSSGEEPYSIALVIMDLMGELDGLDVEIYATDVSTSVLGMARTGVYGENSMRLVGKGHREKYFRERKDSTGNTGHEIHSAVKGMINFAHLNLADTNFPSGVDIIFCRNVVMYFDIYTMIRVMNKLRESLADEGYLFVGHSESLLSMPDRFRMEDWNDAIFYRKLTEGKTLKPAAEEAGEILEEVSRAQLEAEGEITGKIESILVQIIKYMRMKEYDKALSLIGRAHTMDRNVIEPYYLAAEIYVNQGRFDEAKKQLSAILGLNQFFAPAYYLLGSICIEEGNPEEAKNSLRKSLYLDKDFAMAHFEMANVYRSQGRTGDAIRERRNTLKALGGVPPGEIVAYSGGFNAMSLKNICISSIERLKTEG